MGKHVVLAGDSIFDNGVYIDGAPDVAAKLRVALGEEDRVTLLAVDGAICEHAAVQLEALPKDATHLVISCGGNDILHYAALLEGKVDSVASAMSILSAAKAEFSPKHASLVTAAASIDLPVAFCTIYDANMGPLIATAMGLFNDAITRHVHAAGVDLIDLRIVTTEAADYANPIEPSEIGGEKIANAIGRYANEVTERGARTRVFL